MMQSVEFIGTDINPYRIQLVKPDPTGFTIRDIDGLGAGKADLHFAGRASMDGDVFNGARRPSRNLVFQFGYGKDLDPELGRDLSYDVFPLKKRIEMILRTDLKDVWISGIIESNEPDIFTKEPAFNVSIMCDEPYFKSLTEDRSINKLYGLDDLFEFPFSNESTVEDLIVMGEYISNQFVELRYDGNVESGIFIRFIFNGSVVNPSVTLDRFKHTMLIDSNLFHDFVGSPIRSKDVIEINTVRGQRSIMLIRDGQYTSILNALSPSSQWIELTKGLNPISINADSGISSLQTEIIYDNLYSGL